MDLDLIQGAIFLAPGFVALKLFYLLGAQRPRSQWEWTTWSIIASLPINGLAWILRAIQGVPLLAPAPDAFEVTFRILVALALGGAAAGGWLRIRGSDHKIALNLKRQFTDSAWDQALEDAQIHGRPVEVVTEEGTRYRGKLRYAGREDAGAAGWVYLYLPDMFDATTGTFTRYRGSHGVLISREKVRWIRIYLGRDESRSATTEPDLPD